MGARTPDDAATDLAGGEQKPTGELGREVSPAAKRALAEARARRAEADAKAGERPKELLGRKGPDPARYGDWEVKGIASDF
jgi:hypothetical protein